MSIKRFLKLVFLLPIIPILGLPGEGAGGEGGTTPPDDSADAGKDGSGENETKTHTQKDVDAAIEKRLKRERQKFEKQIEDLKKQFTAGGDGEGNANAGGQDDAKPDEAVAKALAAANQRLVQASATTEAVKLGVDPKYISDVVRLADLTKIEVGEDGAIDTGAISKAIDEVLKRVPVFKSRPESAGGFKVGGEGGKPQQGNGWNGQPTEQKRWNRFNR